MTDTIVGEVSAAEAMADLGDLNDGVPVPWHGILAPEGVMSGDKRKFAAGSLTHRDLPVPLHYQTATAGGHDGAVRVANITGIQRSPEGLMQAWGYFASHDNADAAIAEIAERMLRGVSVDVDDAEFTLETMAGEPIEGDAALDEQPVMVVTSGRISGATLCSIPAFQEAFVALGEPPEEWGATMTAAAVEAGWVRVGPLPHSAEDDGEYGDPSKAFAVGDFVAWDGGQGEVKAVSDDATTADVALYDDQGPTGETATAVPMDGMRSWTPPGPGKEAANGIVLTDFAGVPGVMPRKLKEYWTHGEGAARIKWGTPGDFNRCRTNLAEEGVPAHMLAGTCANLHKAALGKWPGREASGQVDVTAGVAITQRADAGETLTAAAVQASDFDNPRLDGPTPLTITDDGRVFGHLATWGTCHVGFPGQCVTPPLSASGYAYFTTGEVRTSDGYGIPVGQITLGTGHAGASLSAKPAMAHYDNTGAAVADVAAGDDAYGIWIAGRVRDGVSDSQVAQLQAAALSGDWRRIGGDMELVAALAVNVPGFPIPRTASAMHAGRQTALVASGVVSHPEDRQSQVRSLAASIGRDRASRVAAARRLVKGE